MQRLVGIDVKLGQYAAGEAFIEQVEEIGGPELLDRVWMAPEYLPDMDEIRSPEHWVQRIDSLTPDSPAALMC